MSRINAAAKQFKKFDINNDGVLNQKDVDALRQKAAEAKKSCNLEVHDVYIQQAADLEKALARSKGGSIKRDGGSRGAYGAKSKGRCKNHNQLQAKMQEMREAKEADKAAYTKDPSAPWKSDDMARDIALKFTHLLRHASVDDKAEMIRNLLDDGSDKPCINNKDRQAILTILDSASPAERQAILNALEGGAERIKQHMGDRAGEFTALAQDAKTGAKQARTKLDGKLKEMKKAKDKDFETHKKDTKAAWKSDDIAREIAADPELLVSSTTQEKMDLLGSLLDSGSQNPWIGKHDCKAILNVLKSASPSDRKLLLNQYGGEIAKHMKGKDAALFQSLCNESGAGNIAKNTGTNAGTGSTSGTSSTNNTSNASNANGTNETSNASNPNDTNGADGSEKAFTGNGYQQLRAAGNKTQQLKREWENESDPVKKKEKLIKFQEAMKVEQQLFELLLKMQKRMHEMAMSAIRNM